MAPNVDEAYYVGFRVGDQEVGLDPHGHSQGAPGPGCYWEADDIQAVSRSGAARSAQVRSRGAATIALRLVSRWAFERNGIHRLQLTTAPANMASQRVAERAGFTREGYLRAWMPMSGGRRDSLMFSPLPTDA